MQCWRPRCVAAASLPPCNERWPEFLHSLTRGIPSEPVRAGLHLRMPRAPSQLLPAGHVQSAAGVRGAGHFGCVWEQHQRDGRDAPELIPTDRRTACPGKSTSVASYFDDFLPLFVCYSVACVHACVAYVAQPVVINLTTGNSSKFP